LSLARDDLQNLIQRTNGAEQDGITEPLIMAILSYLKQRSHQVVEIIRLGRLELRDEIHIV
jgi:hypothetical protein